MYSVFAATVTCPNCKGRDVSRNERKEFFQKALALVLHLFPYHCSSCGRRFFSLHRNRAR
jgi:YgiT-type zinc finger domain-containing protein